MMDAQTRYRTIVLIELQLLAASNAATRIVRVD